MRTKIASREKGVEFSFSSYVLCCLHVFFILGSLSIMRHDVDFV